jgi:cytochrome c553
MKLLNSILAVLAVISCSVPALAGDLRFVYAEKFAGRNCAWCHGPSLQGFFTAPRLAGQTSQYLENQLLNFKGHVRNNFLSRRYMWGAASNHLSLQTVRSLSVYLSRLNPKPADDGYEVLAARGRAIYQGGMPEANIPACSVCHGPNAQGAAAQGAGQIPRLGGLSYYYLKRRLQQWGEGYDTATSRPMPDIASKLSENDTEALASYLSFIK